MDKRQILLVLMLLLKKYKKSRRWFFDNRKEMKTNWGLCHALDHMSHLNPELSRSTYEYLAKCFTERSNRWTHDFWFPKGKLHPRIKLLKYAIKKIKIEIHRESFIESHRITM